jgi:leader peptidase (prepilin peptidase)/N-methyltransferase
MSTAVVVEAGAALLGACVGSFLNVVAYRLPQEDPSRRSLGGRSRCPNCRQQIAWYDNLPVFGWLLRGGRARCCGGRIAVRYPLVEAATAALYWVVVAFPPRAHLAGQALAAPLAASGSVWATVVALWVFVALLVAAALIDLDTFLLLDVLTKPGMALGLVAGLWPGVAGRLSGDPSMPPALDSLLASLLGLLVGGGVVWLVRWAGSRVFRKEAMGFGDVKYLAMIGAFLGWQEALLTLFLACVYGAGFGAIGLCFGGAARIPFGPHLAAGALTAMFARKPILEFLFVTWPEWQRSSSSAPWLLSVAGVLSLFALFVVIRKGRRTG